ncbi:MAG: hypothetical protein ACUVX8_18595 [Candidatus Zipacnadales bacterium]
MICLGSEAVIGELSEPGESCKEIPRFQRQGGRPPPEKLFAEAPLGGAIADYSGVHYATVSRGLRRAEMLDCKT